MMLIRPAKLSDLKAIEHCAITAGAGMSHLPRDQDSLKKQIELSLQSFGTSVQAPLSEYYLFVLEELQSQKICGTCAISARIGVPHPFYTYRIETHKTRSRLFPELKEFKLLRLCPYVMGPSEICGLYLLPEYRHSGIGKLLSLSRFLFITAHPHRFTKTIVANMRGIIENNASAFWNGLGKRFLDVDLETAMQLRTQEPRFVHEAFPPFPILETFLDESIKKALGEIHPNTLPALSMLLHEGFQTTHHIDPIDGGPIIEASVKELHTQKTKKSGVIERVSAEALASDKYIVSNKQVAFRACIDQIKIHGHQVIISESAAHALQVKQGDTIEYISIQKPGK